MPSAVCDNIVYATCIGKSEGKSEGKSFTRVSLRTLFEPVMVAVTAVFLISELLASKHFSGHQKKNIFTHWGCNRL